MSARTLPGMGGGGLRLEAGTDGNDRGYHRAHPACLPKANIYCQAGGNRFTQQRSQTLS